VTSAYEGVLSTGGMVAGGLRLRRRLAGLGDSADTVASLRQFGNGCPVNFCSHLRFCNRWLILLVN
jgi:hypothetical protein